MLFKEQAYAKIKEVSKTPKMYARTKEAYACILSTVLELTEKTDTKKVQKFFWSCFDHNGSVIVGLEDYYDSEWAEDVTKKAIKCLFAE